MSRLVEFVWSWVVVPFGLIGTGFYATLVTFLGRNDPGSPRVEAALRSWSNMWMRMTKIDLHVEGGEDLDPSTSYVVVPNHLSNYDIMLCFLAVPVPIRFLAKKELFKYPLLSQAMRAIGCVEVDRAARSQAVETINRQAALVRSRNHSLLVYAEGTRSRDGELKPFKKGAFAIASGSGMPIVPVGIIGSRDIVPPGTIKIKRHQTVTVRIGTPITDTAGRPITDLRDETRAVVEKLISQP
ncbi:MAG: 1-acyl-sn-glycerol-3-phosphate acyltransferase [Acidimicrobiia bacterium]|nr:1-acyl-sn-glycerol-3-phosphate acyltransferase [Acidimicrobiia bacterium]